MRNQFDTTDFFDKIVSSSQEGRVHIVGEGVEWLLDIVDGQLLFAAHSLQYLTTLETVLLGLGYKASLPAYWRLAQLGPYQCKINDPGLKVLGWTSKVVEALVKHKTLNLEQAEKTLARLSEDAVESLLGLEAATVVWSPLPTGLWHLRSRGVELSSLLNRLSDRLQGWQPLSDRIASPHQRPYCEAPEHINKPVPQGVLPRPMLEMLVRLMQGASIRQLARVANQDEIKLAQLLYPYIKHRVIKLWPPVPPLDQLPWIPTKPLLQAASASPAALLTTPAPLTSNSNGSGDGGSLLAGDGSGDRDSLVNCPATFAKRRYLIICIDDNQLVLEKIQSYLAPERFEFKTVVDPIASIAKICAMKPDLILLDISMPRINGHSLCRILRRSILFKETPIIMISSHVGALNKAKARSVGATDYLEKPFSQAKLMTVLETYLGKPG